ncbi:MAG TPA: DUF6266 family protein [Balneolaceae bacterium]|nr:DUF6266 family protein [Balneolaceae bacterium]
MAKIKDGIFGGFSGRVGNVVGFFRNGKYHLRSVAAHAKNPKTKAQQTHRGKFRLASKLVARVKPFIKKGFSTVPGKTPRGAAMSFNMRSAIAGEHPDLYIDYPQVIVARGLLIGAKEPSVRADDAGNLVFKWQDNTGEGNAKKNDKAMLLAIHPGKKYCAYKLEGTQRNAKQDILELPKTFKGDEIHAYIAFISKDETLVSNSIYLPL